jgi:glycopeptide antibiotics resistance protein
LKPWSWSGELLSWTLAGGLFGLAARELRRRGIVAIAWSVLFAGSVSFAIEAIQILIPSREVDMTSVVLALVGSAVGAFVVERSAIGSTRQWITPALLVWAAAVALAAWTPPHFAWPESPFFRPERLLPFWSYYISSRLTDFAGLFGQLLAFVPLGVLLAVRSRRQSIAGAVLVGLAVGFVFEFGQIFLPARTAEVTSALMAAAGAGLGVALWRWGESLHHSSQGVVRYRVGPQAGHRA